MSTTILVVDDEVFIVDLLATLLEDEGYTVLRAYDGEQGLAVATQSHPQLIITDIMMPKMDGFEVAQRLRRDSRTSSSSIIMLTAKALSSDKVLGLSSGADDYIIKPFDPVELLARVKGTLRRAREMRALSPLTGLPGNIRVQEEIRRRVAEARPFALLYADLDHFKAYNDHYGFVRGDRAIQSLARIATETVHDIAGPEGFVGHVGGDDFVAIVDPELAEDVAEQLCRRFDEHVPSLYDSVDLDLGSIEVRDRQGALAKFPFLTLSIGIATTSTRDFSHYGEAVAIATEMKQFAKRTAGSSYAVDRRTI